MSFKRIAALTAAAVLLALTAACGDKSASSGEESLSPKGHYSDDIEVAKDGPILSFSNVEAAAGETAEVSMYVEGADKNWTMCGIHVTFGEELECIMESSGENMIKYDLGDASKKNTGSVGMLWVKSLPPELTENHLGSLFFTEIFDGDMGRDGEIVKFYFKVPDNAQSGTVYPIGIYYMTDNDIFTNSAGDRSLEKFAFENWQGGSVTVK